MKIVDDATEQDLLESLLEGSKPPQTQAATELDYLLATPFRYDPLRSGSRFRAITDMRRGFDGLASIVQGHLAADPFGGHVFVFRGRRGDLVKLLWWVVSVSPPAFFPPMYALATMAPDQHAQGQAHGKQIGNQRSKAESEPMALTFS